MISVFVFYRFFKGNLSMATLEFMETVEYPGNHTSLRLFRNPSTDEGVMVLCEVAALMGYRSLSGLLRKTKGCSEKIHFFLLEGEELGSFKIHLQEKKIEKYQHTHRLMTITETGIALLLGRRCKEEALRAGQWLLPPVFPKLRSPLQGIYYQKVKSVYLDLSFYLILQDGRCGIFVSQLSYFLNTPQLDAVVRGCYGYVEDIHITPWQSYVYSYLCNFLKDIPRMEKEKPVYLLYESGLYKYLSHIKHPMVSLVKIALEREIFPLLRKSDTTWLPLATSDLRPLSTLTEKTEKASETEAGVYIPALAEHKRSFSLSTGISLPALKGLAISLGVYYMDRVTPHVVFARALVEYSHTVQQERLQEIMESQFGIKSGINKVEIKGKTYHVWKKF
jgi:hypothetical protein